ncbi:MAG: DUF3667 domain-containing protein [Bacteroidota bacterium]
MQDGCLNCGGTLLPNQRFCPACGQRSDTGKLTIRQLLHDFTQVILTTEKGIIRLLKGLAVNPGRVALEYAAGKRKKYFNPFAFMALCVAFMVIINNWLKPYGSLPAPDEKVLARIYDPATKEKYLRTVERNAYVQRIANKNNNTINVIAAPYYALFLWLFFRRRNRNMAEIIVAYLLFAAFSNILSTVIFSPVLAGLRNSSAYYYVQFLGFTLQTAYIAWGMKGFFGFKKTGGYIKMLAALSLIGVTGFIILLVAYFLYVFYGAYDVLRYI